MSDDTDAPRDYASPPCLAGEIAPDYFDPLAVSADQARDVARWRHAERARLRTERQALSVADRAAAGAAIAGHLRGLLSAPLDRDAAGGGAALRGRVLSAYWPIKGEPDLRPLMAELHAGGVTLCLPIVETRAAPLVFRRWTPETAMVRGHWNIPVPPPDADALVPDVMLAPLMGWDSDGYRLGYGGGYFDRTLAASDPRPFTIGIGFQSARLATIYPQPHDIPLGVILTEAGVQTPQEFP
ncbi:5-formyltetrahydrofolate cyclo-ligase [Roseivivax sp. CAU 1753]